MALPKKKRRLPETPKTGSESPDLLIEESVKGAVPASEGSPAMNDQMEKAFELVDSIEEIHPLPETAPGRSSYQQPGGAKGNGHIKFSLQTSQDEQKDESVPVLSIQLKIPALLWKVPVIGGITRNIIRKLSQE